MPVDQKNLDKALDAIKKQLGEDVARKGSDYPELKRIPTGLPTLDSLIGGGIPLGRWVQFYGGYGSAKTLLSLHTIREAQRLGLNVAYYNAEKQWSQPWAEGIGIDTSKVEVFETNVIEEIGGIMETLMGAVNVHVIDSLGAGVSVDEAAVKPEDWLPGISSRAWGKMIRRANSYFDSNQNTVIMINQTREVFGQKGSETPTGGRAISYISSLDLHFKKTSWLFKDAKGNLSENGKKTNSEGEITPEGVEFKIRVNKSRICDPFGVAVLRLPFGTGGHFDREWSLTRAAIFHQMVTRKGAWYELDNGEKFQGESALKDYIAETPEFQAKIEEVMGLVRD